MNFFDDTKLKNFGIRYDDLKCVVNFKNTWEHLLKTINEEITLDYWLHIHTLLFTGLIGESTLGTLRKAKAYMPNDKNPVEPPNEIEVRLAINCVIRTSKPVIERAIDLFLFGYRSQLFGDGNKRVANFIANKFLIENGVGIMIFSNSDYAEYVNAMLNYWATNSISTIKHFLEKLIVC
ncbi:MAG: Fic family protein [Defluviitaleaceae bacterium]|nr:Fic family protein [Defluviitaleaceae bacterium]